MRETLVDAYAMLLCVGACNFVCERVMIERIEKEIETQIYKDILITSDDDRKKISISKSTKIN